MSSSNVLFVTHPKTKCGVYEFGENVFDSIKSSSRYNFIKVECADINGLRNAIDRYKPAAIIYNYHPTTMTWITKKWFRLFIKSNVAHLSVPQVGIIHEMTQEVVNGATQRKKRLIAKINNVLNSLFDYYIVADPTILLKNPIVYKTGRVIPKYMNKYSASNIPVIASFGFGTNNKGFARIVQIVQEEFDIAKIHINIPFGEFADKYGENTRKYIESCKSQIYKPGIELNITHEYWGKEGLLDFLAQSTVNVFFYEDKSNRGISSVLDYALAVDRPIAVSSSVMFRHVLDAQPSICVDKISLKEIIKNGTSPLLKYINDWTPENLLWDYERILSSVLQSRQEPKRSFLNRIKQVIRTLLCMNNSSSGQRINWLRTTEKQYEDDYKTIAANVDYKSIKLPPNNAFNRILDDSARDLYAPTIRKLFELVPKTMAKKIPDANVNQAFVFDAVHRLIRDYPKPKILCVGSYEDTACMSLVKMGHDIEEIDPMVNYSVQEFLTKPTTRKQSYDIVFSTSVIEHDPDDRSFMEAVDSLLAPGGVFIMTCDYKDGWMEGDIKPEVCARFYTQNDLKVRLLSYIKNCKLIDEPKWECADPDFIYGKYKYTFATFVVKKEAK